MVAIPSCRLLRLILLPAVFLAIRPAVGEDRESQFQRELLPLLRTYCFDCHGESDAEGGVSLAKDQSADQLRKNRRFWLSAKQQVELGAMPPEDFGRLEPATRARMANLIEGLANAIDCVKNPNPGRVTIRRLNRREYRNTIRDLVGVDYQPAEQFPGDDVGYGFDNIGDVLSLPPLLMEKYLDAAEEIAGRAIYTPPPPRVFRFERRAVAAEGAKRFGSHGGRVNMASHGTISIRPELPFGGKYTLTVTAGGDQGGDEPVKIEVAVAGKRRGIIEVASEDAEDHSMTLRLPSGKRELAFTFINDFYRPEEGIDRNAHLYHIHLEGTETTRKYVAKKELPRSHRVLLFVEPSESVSAEAASRRVIYRLASRAFRRVVTPEELQRLTRLAAQVRGDGGSFEASMQVVLQALLVSPHFLFKVEQPRPATPGQPAPRINQFELATRISYFLWSSMPDDQLLAMAGRGELRDPAKLRPKIAKMLADPRSGALVENFAGQWLQLRNLDQVTPDPRAFRDFDPEIAELMQRETLTFFAAVMRRNLPVTTLLDGQFTFLNAKLARFYRIPEVEGDHFREVSLANSPRGGLLTHGSVLTVTSNPTRTSPVKRGKWILDVLLNEPPPPAPPNVPELDKGPLTGSLRERLEQHRDNPACAACHRLMDPLGFALENFDAVGRYRSHDAGLPIDAAGALPDGTRFDGIADLRRTLAERHRDQFVRCLIEKMMTYAVGRGIEYYDRCTIDEIESALAAKDYRFASLIAAIIESDPFQKQGERE